MDYCMINDHSCQAIKLYTFFEFQCKDSVKEWWFEVIQWAVDRDLDDKLVLKVRDDLSNNMDPKINTPVRRYCIFSYMCVTC